MSDRKEERLQIRIDERAKLVVEQAAQAVHLSVSAFVLQAAQLRAEEIMAERAMIPLPPEAAEAFSRALERPAEVNQRLARALGRPRRFAWID